MNICIVDDNESLLAKLKLLLDGESGMQVTGCFTSAEQALALGNWTAAHILIVDLELPHMSGTDLIRRLHLLHPDLFIIVHTLHEDRPSVLNAIRAGAGGYLLKGSRPRQLIEALHDMLSGGAPMSPKIARSVLLELQQAAGPRGDAENAKPEKDDRLTPRELQILRLCEKGLVYKEISDRLSITKNTVHSHVKQIYRKLQAHNATDAIRKGRARGLL
jgi:two-component system NarL family response regulator